MNNSPTAIDRPKLPLHRLQSSPVVLARALASIVAILGLPGMPDFARAETPPAVQGAPVAQALFETARRLMEEGKFAEACPKLAESHRLDPAAGTLLNLAVCHEKEGKMASAWVEYNDLLAIKGGDNGTERRRIAAERITEIEPRLAHVTFVPEPEDEALDLVIALDGAQLHRAAIGVPLPVDPGAHRIAVTAPGRKTWWSEIAAVEPGTSREVHVPPLEPLDPPAAPRGSLAAGTKIGAAAQLPPANPRRSAAYVTAAGALVALAAAGYFGYLAKNEWDRRNDRCVPDCDNPDATSGAGRARTLARVADVAAGLGIVMGAIGAYLYVTSAPSAAVSTGGPSLAASADHLSLSYWGAF